MGVEVELEAASCELLFCIVWLLKIRAVSHGVTEVVVILYLIEVQPEPRECACHVSGGA
jgi:hypothetical protein